MENKPASAAVKKAGIFATISLVRKDFLYYSAPRPFAQLCEKVGRRTVIAQERPNVRPSTNRNDERSTIIATIFIISEEINNEVKYFKAY